MSEQKRRAYGSGSIQSYKTKTQGTLYSATYLYVDKGGVRKQRKLSGFKTKREASKALSAALAERDSGRHLDPTGITVADYAHDTYLPRLVRRERAPITVENYTRALNRWVLPQIGHLPVQRVTYRDVNGLIDSMRGLSPATIRLCLTLLSAMMTMAVADEIVHVNPVQHPNVDRPTGGATSDRTPWEVDEARQFLASLHPDKDDMDLAFFVMALTGIRRGEAAGLRWGDVNLDAGLLRVSRSVSTVKGVLHISEGGKTANATRVVGLPARAVELLTRHKMREAERFWASGHTFSDESPVFATWLCGPRAPHTFTTRFTAAVRRAKVRPVPLHALRHLAITQAQMTEGISPAIVGQVVGHGSQKVTAGYTHAGTEAALKVAQAISTRLLGETG